MHPLLSVVDFSVNLQSRSQPVQVVTDVSFQLGTGQTMAVIGESGCGKTSLALALLGLGRAGSQVSTTGSVKFDDRELVGATPSTLRSIRGKSIALVSQNPQTSFDPILTIGRQMREVLRLHTTFDANEYTARMVDALRRVGIPEASRRLDDYPHQFSGGMLQRVLLATALLTSPKLLIADEPTSALDVTVQAQILELLMSIQGERNMALLLITHDLGVAARMSDTLCVMYAGRFVEVGPTQQVLVTPRMPYTQGLLAATPCVGGEQQRWVVSIRGMPPAFAAVRPPGCSFRARCDHHQDVCDDNEPKLRQVGGDHFVACHFDVMAPVGGMT